MKDDVDDDDDDDDDDGDDNDKHIIIIRTATRYRLDGPGIEYH